MLRTIIIASLSSHQLSLGYPLYSGLTNPYMGLRVPLLYDICIWNIMQKETSYCSQLEELPTMIKNDIKDWKRRIFVHNYLPFFVWAQNEEQEHRAIKIVTYLWNWLEPSLPSGGSKPDRIGSVLDQREQICQEMSSQLNIQLSNNERLVILNILMSDMLII